MKNFQLIQKEYYKISGLKLYKRETNLLNEKIERKDSSFEELSRLYFDDRKKILLIEKKLPNWLALSGDSDTIFALAGYVYYLKEDYNKAQNYFLKTIQVNPDNFDTWRDLAFTYRHLDKMEFFNTIMFYHRLVTHYYKKLDLKGCGHEKFEKLLKEIKKRADEKERTKIK